MSESVVLPELSKQECLLIVQALQVYGREVQKAGRTIPDLFSLTNEEDMQPMLDEFKNLLSVVDQLTSKILNTV